MLLQKLHRDESLAIGSDIRVVVIAVNPATYRVTLGIEAPPGFAISRESSCSKTSENPVGKNIEPASGILVSPPPLEETNPQRMPRIKEI